MKAKIFLITSFFSIFCYSQYTVQVVSENSSYLIDYEVTNDTFLQADAGLKNKILIKQAEENFSKNQMEDGNLDGIVYRIKEINNDIKLEKIKKGDEIQNGESQLSVNAENKEKIVFLIQIRVSGALKDQGEKKVFVYCKPSEDFRPDEVGCREKQGNNIDDEDSIYNDITQIPFPQFLTPSEELPKSKTHRYLIIDGNSNPLKKSNTTLYRFKKEGLRYKEHVDTTFADNFHRLLESTRSIPKNSSLSIFMAYQGFETIKNVTIQISGTEYSFNKDISNVLESLSKKDRAKDQSVDDQGKELESASEDLTKVNAQRSSYLQKVESYLYDTSKPIKYLNINDLIALEQYKKSLQEVLQEKKDGIELGPNDIKLLSRILDWYPDWISLTPIAKLVLEADEVDVKATINYIDGSSDEEIIGKYRISGGMAFNLGSRIYLTGLKNNKIFTEDIENEDGSTEKRARINKENQTSIGIGLNGEIAFRTGGIANPTLNLGFFIPFEEEITPYLAFGPGLTLTGDKVKFSFGGGIAFGSVNSIAERFVDEDASNITDVTTLSEKIWDSSWYISIGFSYKLSDGN